MNCEGSMSSNGSWSPLGDGVLKMWFGLFRVKMKIPTPCSQQIVYHQKTGKYKATHACNRDSSFYKRQMISCLSRQHWSNLTVPNDFFFGLWIIGSLGSVHCQSLEVFDVV